MSVPLTENVLIITVFATSLFFLPQLYFRQSLGMWICDLTTLCPLDKEPLQSIMTHKFMNIVEYVLPSPIYYFFTAMSAGNNSIAEKTSSCKIVRKKYLMNGEAPQIKKSATRAFLTASLFTLLPLFIITGLMIAIIVTFQLTSTEALFEFVEKNFPSE